MLLKIHAEIPGMRQWYDILHPNKAQIFTGKLTFMLEAEHRNREVRKAVKLGVKLV